MRLIGKTDKQQFEELFKKNYQSLFYCALDIVADEDNAKDIVSEVFTDLWEDFHKKQKMNLEAYLYTSVKNRAIDFQRHIAVTRQYEKVFLEMEKEWEETNESQKEENIQRIYKILNELSPKTHEIFVKCYFKGKKYQEVADEMNVSVAAIHKHIVKALAKLRKDFLEINSNR